MSTLTNRVAATSSRLIGAAVLAVALCAIHSPAVAQAADTVIGFDDQPAHTEIENQYSSKGITFNETPSGLTVAKSTVVAPAGGEAHSPPNVLDVSVKCGSEFHEIQLWGRFAAPRNHVSLFVGNLNLGLGFPATIVLEGFDLGGNPIPGAKEQVEISGFGVDNEMGIESSNSEISFFKLASDAECHVGIDDLSFDSLPSSIPPDFGLSGPSLATTLTPGGSASVPLVLHRNSTSVGPISFVVSDLPPGVEASVSPNPSSGPDGSALTLNLSAKANAPPFSNSLVTVEGVPSAGAGEHNRSVQIPVSVAGNFDLRAQGLEVTQGIQPEGELKPSGSSESGGSYNGVDLIAHKQTAVRFFTDAHGQIGSGIKEVGALLYGFRDGHELPGSPLRPDYGPPSTKSGGPGLTSIQEEGSAPVLEAERTSNENAYTFTLPVSWTSGTISLGGNVFQEPGFPQPGRRAECSTADCKANNSFTIKDLTFYNTKTVELDTVALSVNGELPVPASVALEDAKLVTPLANPGWNPRNPNDGFTVLPYQGIIDISDIVNDKSSNETSKGGAAHGRVRDWASAMGFPNFSTMGIGIGGFRGVTGGGLESVFGSFGNLSAITFNPANPPGNRPLSGVAHELFHQFGLAHASSECGGGDDGDSDDEGQSSTPWPLKPGETHASEAAVLGEPGQFVNNGGDNPNSTEGFGQLLGIGLRMDSYPYRIVADGVNWGQNMDLMSYCAAKTGGFGRGDPGVWVSPINWDAVYRTFASSAAASSSRFAGRTAPGSSSESEARGDRAATSHASAAKRGGRPNAHINRRNLRVVGYYNGSSFHFTSVGPQVGPPLKAGTSSFTLLARGRRGQILRSVPMAAQHIHEDAVAALLELSAEIPSHGVESVEVLDNGVSVGSRKRPRRRPKVRVLAPHRGAVAGGRRSVAVKWRTVGASAKNCTASVDFSSDGGRTWQPVFIGPDRGRARISGSYLAAAHRARVRVRVNDGFDEAAASSGIFTSLAAPPLVTIANLPKELPGDAVLQLTGQAFQAGPTALKGRRLRWFDSSVPLGSGTVIMAGPLPPGKNRIRLLARGAGGSTATASVNVKVKPVRLPFLRLSIPEKVPRGARKIVLKARSAVPTRLTVNAGRFKIGTKTKKLRVTIRPRGQSWLHMAATAQGVRTAFSAIVKRG
jgi:hypothetical protein